MAESKRNNSIDIFRYVAALLIVAHHTDLFADVNPYLSYLFSQVITRIGVPFFFAVSGYFYTKKLENCGGSEWSCCFKYVKRLLVTYAFWSAVYFLIDMVFHKTPNGGNYLASFFVFGSEYHFWFFPALITWVLFVTLLYKAKLKKLLPYLGCILYAVGLLGTSYYKIGCRIPLLSALYENPDFVWIDHVFLLGLPFFICGWAIQKYEKRFKKATVNVCLAASAVLYFVEIFTLKILDVSRMITLSISLAVLIWFLLLFLIAHPAPKLTALSQSCRSLAGVTFYSHVIFIELFNAVNKSLLNGALTETPRFVFVAVMTFVLGFVLSKINNRFIKSIIN